MNFFTRAAAFINASALLLCSTFSYFMLPINMAKIGSIAVASALLVPSQAHAEKNKRICSAVAAAPGIVVGYMIKLRKGDVAGCDRAVDNVIGALIKSSHLPFEVKKMIPGNASPQILAKVNAFKPINFQKRKSMKCEDFTAMALSGHWGGDVCNSMRQGKVYAFVNTTNAAGILEINVP